MRIIYYSFFVSIKRRNKIQINKCINYHIGDENEIILSEQVEGMFPHEIIQNDTIGKHTSR